MTNMSYFEEALRRNPERLSKADRDQREAEQVALQTKHSIIGSDGNERPSKRFVTAYTKMLSEL